MPVDGLRCHFVLRPALKHERKIALNGFVDAVTGSAGYRTDLFAWHRLQRRAAGNEIWSK
jgi:hypothetical protein